MKPEDEVIALPTAPGVTVYASDVHWECPACHESGVGEQSLFGHATKHVDSTVLLTRLKLEGLVIVPGALTLKEDE